MPNYADYTPTGVKIEGAYENDRNAAGADCFKKILREAFDVTDVIVGHHLIYVYEDKRDDGFTYQIVEELPSADALIFDHDIARKIWGEDWKAKLQRLAIEPVETRDALLSEMYHARGR
jgi:uncharacterized membrane protein